MILYLLSGAFKIIRWTGTEGTSKYLLLETLDNFEVKP